MHFDLRALMKVVFSIIGILAFAALEHVPAQFEPSFSLSGLQRGPRINASPESVEESRSAEVLKLLYENKADEAVAESVAHLNALVPSFLEIDAGKRTDFQQETNFVQFLKVYDLADAVIAALPVTGEASLEERISRTAITEMLGNIPAAMAGYEKILQQAPMEDGIRVRLIFLLAEHDDLDGAEIFSELSPEALPPLAQALADKIQSIQENEFERRLKYVELLAILFEQADPKQYISADWLPSLLDHSIGQSNYGNTIRFADLYSANTYSVGYNNPEQEERSREIEERRRLLHDRLCRALLQLPQFADLGFERLCGLALRDGEDAKTYEKLAEQLLLQMPAAPSADDPSRPENTYRTVYREHWVPFLTPVEFLVKSATESGDYRLLEEKVIPELKASGKDDMASFAEAMIDLASSSDEEFAGKAVALIKRDYPTIELGNLMRRIIEMREARDIDVDLGPILLAYFHAMRFKLYETPSYVSNYGREIAAEGGDAFARFIDDSAVAMLGPEEQQKAFIEENYQPNVQDPKSPGNAIRNYGAFLGQMIESPAMAALPLKKAFDLDLVHPNDYQLRNQLQNNLRYHRLADDPQAVYQFLKDMGFLNDIETIEFYPMRNINHETLFGYMLYNLSRIADNQKDRVLQPIIDHPEDTFGKAMLIASSQANTNSSSQRDAITGALEPFMDQLLRLPEEKQEQFLYWYSQMINRNSLPMSLQRTAPKVAKWYEPWRKSDRASQMMMAQQTDGSNDFTLEEFLEVEKRDKFNRGSGLDYVAQQLMQKLAPETGGDEIESFVMHYVKLARQPLPHQPGVEQEPNPAPLLSIWLNSAPSLASLGKAIKVLQACGFTEQPLTNNLELAVRSALSTARFDNPGADADTFLEQSAGHYDERLTPLFAQRFAALDQEARKAVMEWAAGTDSVLAQAWHIAAALTLAPSAEVQERWLTELSHPERSLALRLHTATIIGPIAANANAWNVARASIETFASAWDEETVMVPSEPASNVLSSFLAQGSEKSEAVELSKAFLSEWTAHANETPMSIAFVKQILELDDVYGVQAASWLAGLPQSTQRQAGFLTMVIRHAPPEAVVPVLPWAYVAMPQVTQTSRSSQRQIRYVNGQRQVHYVQRNTRNNNRSHLDSDRLDKVLWDRSQAFLKQVPDPGARFYAEMLLSALPDAPALEGVPAREERLRDLTARYDRELFASPYLAEHTVSWLCSLNEGVTDDTREAVAYFGDQIDFSELAEWYDGNLRSSRQGLLNNYVQDASKNNPDAFAKLLAVMLERADRQNGEAQRLLETYCQGFPQNLLQGPELLSEEEARTYLPLLRELTEMSREIRWNGRDECISGNFAMHVLANEADGYRTWLLSLDENTRMQVYSETNLDRVVYLLRDGLNAEDLSRERRFEILNGLFSAGASPEELFSSNNMRMGNRQDSNVFKRMIDLNVLKKEEVLEHGSHWAEANPRQGAAYGELANFQAEAGDVDEAVLNYVQAVAYTPLTDRAAYTNYHLAKTRLLLKEDRVDAAMSWLEFLDRGRLDGNREEEVEQLFRQTRFQYLLAPKRLESKLAELRARLGQDPRDYGAWHTLAEIVAAAGNDKMDSSDYFRGAAFLKLSYYILARLSEIDPEFDEGQFERTKEELARGLVAVGMGGKRQYLINQGSLWDYHYQEGGIPGTAWRQTDFSKGPGWKTGRAPLGYGDGDEVTVLDYGEDEDNKPVTAYFRKEFEVADPGEFDELTMRILHDDGVVVYLNGEMVVKNNMPESVIEPETFAPETRSNEVENEYWPTTFPADLLRPSSNLIAVEVHQRSRDSSDVGFDLEIYAEAIRASEVFSEVESGATMKLLKAWKDRLPPDVVELVKGL